MASQRDTGPKVSPLKLYAANTKISAATTKQQIEQLLVKYGADQFGVAFDSKKGVAMVVFSMDTSDGTTLQVRMTLPVSGDGVDQKSKASWRALLLSIQAKLICIDQGISTLEKEFFADIVMPNGDTMNDYYQPQLKKALTSLAMPPLIPGLEAKKG